MNISWKIIKLITKLNNKINKDRQLYVSVNLIKTMTTIVSCILLFALLKKWKYTCDAVQSIFSHAFLSTIAWLSNYVH